MACSSKEWKTTESILKMQEDASPLPLEEHRKGLKFRDILAISR
jgi:hypothetical protein